MYRTLINTKQGLKRLKKAPCFNVHVRTFSLNVPSKVQYLYSVTTTTRSTTTTFKLIDHDALSENQLIYLFPLAPPLPILIHLLDPRISHAAADVGLEPNVSFGIGAVGELEILVRVVLLYDLVDVQGKVVHCVAETVFIVILV